MRLLRSSPALLFAAACVFAGSGCHGDGSSGPRVLVAPGNAAATATSANTIRLTFTAVDGAKDYAVERADANGEFAEVGTTGETSFDDVGLEPTTLYRYRVVARRGSERGPYSAVVQATTLGTGGNQSILRGSLTSSRILTADTVYVLSGPVRMVSGGTLRIGAGTKIVGDTTVVGSSLLIERGAKIIAEGSRAHPIVFTSQRAPGRRKPGDWGGVSIVGNARINLQVQNIQSEGPQGGTQDYAGGTDDDDDSGVLRYVRIEFAGQQIGQNEKMNSLSLYAVGRGTTIEYVETLAGLDDGFKWFGGTVNGRYLVSYEAGDDNFDISQGYSGHNQYVIGLQSTVLGAYEGNGSPTDDHNFIESDGCESGVTGCPANFDAAPYSMPLFANFTAMGPWSWNIDAYGGNGVVIRRGSGMTLLNAAILRWPKTALTVRDAFTETLRQRDSLTIRNIFMAENGANFDPADAFYGQREKFSNSAIEESGTSASALFAHYEPSSGTLDWTPASGSPLASGGLTSFSGVIAARAGTFIQPTSYRGAADPAGAKWWDGWTAYARD